MAFTDAFCPAGTRRLPEWVPDSTCSQCSACRSPFTLLRRRHHCRSCGKVGGGRAGVRGVPQGPSSTQLLSGPLLADLLCPLLATHCSIATLWPAETCACLHALLCRPPLTHAPARPEPVRDPWARSASAGGCRAGGNWPLRGCWAAPQPHASPRGWVGTAAGAPLMVAGPHTRWQPVSHGIGAGAAVGAGPPHPVCCG